MQGWVKSVLIHPILFENCDVTPSVVIYAVRIIDTHLDSQEGIHRSHTGR